MSGHRSRRTAYPRKPEWVSAGMWASCLWTRWWKEDVVGSSKGWEHGEKMRSRVGGWMWLSRGGGGGEERGMIGPERGGMEGWREGEWCRGWVRRQWERRGTSMLLIARHEEWSRQPVCRGLVRKGVHAHVHTSTAEAIKQQQHRRSWRIHNSWRLYTHTHTHMLAQLSLWGPLHWRLFVSLSQTDQNPSNQHELKG